MINNKGTIQEGISIQSISKKDTNQYLAWAMVAIAASFYSYEFILRVAPSTMFNELTAFYHISATHVGNIIIFYMLAYTPMQLLVGPLYDKFGVKKLLLFAIACCILGSYLLSACNSILVCKVSIFLMGLGSSFAFVGVLKLAASHINSLYLGLASGITTALGMLGGIWGQSITAYINVKCNWQYSWRIYTFIGAIIFIIVATLIKEAMDQPVSHMHKKLFFKELIELAQNKIVLLCGLIGGILFMPISVIGSLWGVPYLTSLSSQISTLAASNTVNMVFVGMIIGCPLAGIMSQYISGKKLLVIASICLIVLYLFLIFVKSTSLVFFGTVLFLIGLVCGTEVLTFTIPVESNLRHLAASSVAFVNFIMMTMGVLCQYLIGLVLNCTWDGTKINGIAIYNAHSYKTAFTIIPLISVIALILFIRGIYSKKNKVEKTLSIKSPFFINSNNI